MAADPKVSVIMCTRNRAEQLRRVLETAAGMVVPEGLAWEFLLVDNGSTDHTAETVASFADRLPVRHVYEATAGLSNARNRGIAEARGEYICWTDDDVEIDSGWLAAYAAAFAAYPEAAFFGGRVEPVFEKDLPAWWVDNYEQLSSIVAERDLGPRPIPLATSADGLPFGANFAVRTAEQRRHLYDPRLGVGPDCQRLGEETAVIEAIMREGGTGMWVPEARVRHIIPAKRLTLDYVGSYYRSVGETWEYLSSTGQSDPRYAHPEGGRRIFGAPAWFWRLAIKHRLLYVPSCLVGSSASWLHHWLEYNLYVGRIRYWTSRRTLGGKGPVAP